MVCSRPGRRLRCTSEAVTQVVVPTLSSSPRCELPFFLPIPDRPLAGIVEFLHVSAAAVQTDDKENLAARVGRLRESCQRCAVCKMSAWVMIEKLRFGGGEPMRACLRCVVVVGL